MQPHGERTRVNLFSSLICRFYWFPKYIFPLFFWEGGDSRNLFLRFIFLFWKYRRVFIISPLFWKSWPRWMAYFTERSGLKTHVSTLFVTIALTKDRYVNLDTISRAHVSDITCTHKKTHLIICKYSSVKAGYRLLIDILTDIFITDNRVIVFISPPCPPPQSCDTFPWVFPALSASRFCGHLHFFLLRM